MEVAVKAFFEHYARAFMRALGGDGDLDQVVALYAPEFIAASPAGVRAAKNDDGFRQALAQGYDHYRYIGMTDMRLGNVHVSRVDDLHCTAKVGWVASYTREHQPNVTIGFDVHYLLQILDGEPKVFGWISGDEQALLRQHGLA